MKSLTFTAFIGLLVFSMVFVSCEHLEKVKSEEADPQNTGEVSQDETPEQLPPEDPPEQLPPDPPVAGNVVVTVPTPRPRDKWDPIPGETDTKNTGEVSQDETPKQLPPEEPLEQLPPDPPIVGNAVVTVPAPRPRDEWDPILREKNTAYLREKLGAKGEDEWFTVIPQEPAYFYFIAVSSETATEQRARTNAQGEARNLLRAYHEVMTGTPPGSTIGRGIEVIEWYTINDVSPEGRQYYIACALVRIPVQGVIK